MPVIPAIVMQRDRVVKLLAVGAIAVLATGGVAGQRRQAGPAAPITIQKQGSFSVGGTILGDPDTRSLHCDHGYVDYQIPVNPRRINCDGAQPRRRARPAAIVWGARRPPGAVLGKGGGGGRGHKRLLPRRAPPFYLGGPPQ